MMIRKLVIALCAVGIAGCSSSKETKKTEETSDFTEVLHKYESTFDPSEYGPDATMVTETGEAKTGAPVDPSEIVAVETPEVVPGFRVQLFATTSIDEANAKKTEAESLFPEEWFYVVYDPPVYKLRSGNFLTRFEADRFSKRAAERGYVDAWTVPDRVIKNLSPRLSPHQNEQQQK
ncbi:MAG: SPOR domain-containing protein [Ignavibacteriae bacterium]|nr:SPOR domain-containing protein [Ignavibacteriota bacterium]